MFFLIYVQTAILPSRVQTLLLKWAFLCVPTERALAVSDAESLRERQQAGDGINGRQFNRCCGKRQR